MRKHAALLPARRVLIPSSDGTKLPLRLLAVARDACCTIPLAFLISCGLCLSLCTVYENQVSLLAHPPLITPLFFHCREAEDGVISFHQSSALRATAFGSSQKCSFHIVSCPNRRET